VLSTKTHYLLYLDAQRLMFNS